MIVLDHITKESWFNEGRGCGWGVGGYSQDKYI